ncbi:prepilin peptidase [Streptomyces sp. NBC_00828]
MSDLLLTAVAALWGAAAGLLVPRAAYRFAVDPDETWRDSCPAGHPITGTARGWLGLARCGDCTAGVAPGAGGRAALGSAERAAPGGAGDTSSADAGETSPADSERTPRDGQRQTPSADAEQTHPADAEHPSPYAGRAHPADMEHPPPCTGRTPSADAEHPPPDADQTARDGDGRVARDGGPVSSDGDPASYDTRGASVSNRVPAWYGPSTPLVSLATALLCAVLALVTGTRPELGVWLLLAPLAVLLAVVDFKVQRLPDVLTLSLAAAALVLLGVAAAVPEHAGDWLTALFGALALGGGYFVLFLINPNGMGFGDVKLALGLGAVLGWYGWSVVFLGTFAGFLLGALYGAGLVVARRAGRKSSIPFGPFLIAGAYAGLLVGAYAA